jgi:putative flippase GtrA
LKNSQKQVVKYTIIGISAVLLDLLVYYASSFPIKSLSVAKGLGFAAGSIYTFYLNKAWTWKDNEKTSATQLSRFFIIYGVSLLINIVVNQISIDLLPDHELYLKLLKPNKTEVFSFYAQVDKFIAFGLATVASAVWNFSGQKYWVFRNANKSA